MSREKQAITFRLDIKSTTTGTFIPYSHRDGHPSLEMIEALARGLKRQHQPGRIVELPSGEILDQWGAE